MLALWSNPNAGSPVKSQRRLSGQIPMPALWSNPNAALWSNPNPGLRSNPNAGSLVKSQHQLFSQNVALII